MGRVGRTKIYQRHPYNDRIIYETRALAYWYKERTSIEEEYNEWDLVEETKKILHSLYILAREAIESWNESPSRREEFTKIMRDILSDLCSVSPSRVDKFLRRLKTDLSDLVKNKKTVEKILSISLDTT